MPSRSLQNWLKVELPELDKLEVAHWAVGGRLGGRGALTQAINDAYLVLLAARFQQFCRDLHSEAASVLASTLDPALSSILQGSLTLSRKLDSGNANPASVQQDFRRLGLDLWKALEKQDKRNALRRARLEQLNSWRNAIVHQDFRKLLGSGGMGGTKRDLRWAKRWRSICKVLAVQMDRAVQLHLSGLLGRPPW